MARIATAIVAAHFRVRMGPPPVGDLTKHRDFNTQGVWYAELLNAPATLVAFVVALLGVFGAAVLVGGAVGPEPRSAEPSPEGGGHGAMAAADPVRGLAVAERGLRLVVDTPELRRGRDRARCASASSTPAARPCATSTSSTRKRMHLIVVRRDLTGFQHLHPTLARRRHLVGAACALADGRLLPRVRRLLARRRGHDARRRPARRRRRRRCAPLPAPRPTAAATAATRSASTPAPRAPARRPSCASRSPATARPVDTEPYLGAGGHLVALREGDLAFLHVHPTSDGRVGFAATFPTAGRYRLFLQFKHDGPGPHRRVHPGGRSDEPRTRARRAPDHRHDLRVVREPHRAQAQQARRRQATVNYATEKATVDFDAGRGRARAARRRRRGRRLPGGRCPAAEPEAGRRSPTTTAPLRRRLIVSRRCCRCRCCCSR